MLIIATLVGARASAYEPRSTLADLPVTDMTIVAPTITTVASKPAKGSGTPLDITLAIVGKFEGSTQQIIQINEGGESPSASRVTVLRDGLLDDSVRGERWDITFARNAKGAWTVKEVKRAWRCWRGPQTDRFSATLCR
jgi:hypothetical protein